MNTLIVKISDDQNTITHESGFVTVFEEKIGCSGCYYYEIEDCNHIPCIEPRRTVNNKEGIFKLKQ